MSQRPKGTTNRLAAIPDHSTTAVVSEERLSTNDAGEVIYRFKKPWDDGTTALKLNPMELMERLVALVPWPRVHLTRYHGVLGPHYKHRKQIVSKPPDMNFDNFINNYAETKCLG